MSFEHGAQSARRRSDIAQEPRGMSSGCSNGRASDSHAPPGWSSQIGALDLRSRSISSRSVQDAATPAPASLTSIKAARAAIQDLAKASSRPEALFPSSSPTKLISNHHAAMRAERQPGGCAQPQPPSQGCDSQPQRLRIIVRCWGFSRSWGR